MGAPLEELPIVDQIPILHRLGRHSGVLSTIQHSIPNSIVLDHSIHSTTLWSIREARRLANDWNVDGLFMITHCDIINYLSQLNFLKFADHSASIEKGGLDVHTEVCANMRAKLSSEIVVNRQKMKASF